MTTAQSMQAAVLDSPGAPFRVAPLPRPHPQSGQVLVRIKASAVNPLDLKIRAGQAAHVARAEHVAHHAVGLVHVEVAAVRRRDAGGVLTAMLQEQQTVIDQLVDRGLGNYAYDAAHGMSFKGTKFVMAAAACDGVPRDFFRGVREATRPNVKAAGLRRCPAAFPFPLA